MGLSSKILYVLSALIIALIATPFITLHILQVNDVSTSAPGVDLSSLSEKVSLYYVEYLPPEFMRLLKNVGLDKAVKQLDHDEAVLERALVFVHSERVAKNLPWYTELLTTILSTCRKCAVA